MKSVIIRRINDSREVYRKKLGKKLQQNSMYILFSAPIYKTYGLDKGSLDKANELKTFGSVQNQLSNLLLVNNMYVLTFLKLSSLNMFCIIPSGVTQ